VRPQKWARLTSRSQMTSITVAIMTKGRRFGVVRRFFSPNHFFRLHNGCCAGIRKIPHLMRLKNLDAVAA
jgi:hypothetical protein